MDNKSETRIGCFLSQFAIVAKFTLETNNSPIETGEALPLGIKKRLANSTDPLGDIRDLAKLTLTPNSVHRAR